MEDELSIRKRRLTRACDRCRVRKSDHDAEQGNRCSSCIAVESECTYVAPARKRGHKSNYVAGLVRRAGQLERIIKEVRK
ncbi:uncharacterized protein EV420DRAFT_1602270 [Desarmillaria tabescens]|uniref:Zn(2)-C6 fungal-type domain-containing protein n=1 Tax=Armillaria tabescens TaxID=1929756 RepID=A0AA39J009_ARMTA|nr:uncharacterized protein EV420DRAFT_1602270 [Desarmillaria tabescens]KAK0432975.1 hypothetical protein EV420DRAFT_1602270 [Desarmillaria tabescens]